MPYKYVFVVFAVSTPLPVRRLVTPLKSKTHTKINTRKQRSLAAQKDLLRIRLLVTLFIHIQICGNPTQYPRHHPSGNRLKAAAAATV